MDSKELDAFECENILHWERLKVFFILKTALSPVIETVILLDRLLYLYEKVSTAKLLVFKFHKN